MDRAYSKPSPSGHTEGDPSPRQTNKKPKDLCSCDGEDRGHGEGGGVYVVYMCEQGVWDREGEVLEELGLW